MTDEELHHIYMKALDNDGLDLNPAAARRALFEAGRGLGAVSKKIVIFEFRQINDPPHPAQDLRYHGSLGWLTTDPDSGAWYWHTSLKKRRGGHSSIELAHAALLADLVESGFVVAHWTSFDADARHDLVVHDNGRRQIYASVTHTAPSQYLLKVYNGAHVNHTEYANSLADAQGVAARYLRNEGRLA